MIRLGCYAIVCLLLVAATAGAVPLNINAYVDDFATITIDGIVRGSYHNPAAAGNIVFVADLTPGWHDIAIDYANQAGTNFLALQEQYPGDPTLSFVPLAALIL